MDKLYEFEKMPENVRQIGEPGEKERIYFEDYVVTYMERIFRKEAEKKIVIYLGKEGKGECSGYYFIYGALELKLDILDAEQFFSADKWEEIHNQMKAYFPEGQILGWGVGIRTGTHSLRKRMEEIHRKHFPKGNQICYIYDQSEETKSLYFFDGLKLQKKQGYMVYYGKNPQMQDYMLRGEQRASLDAEYTDSVITNVRAIVKRNEEKRQGKRTATAVAAVFLVLLFMTGGFILLQSNKKLEKLEETLAVVSEPQLSEKEQGSSGQIEAGTVEKEENDMEEPGEKEEKATKKATEEPENQPEQKTAEEPENQPEQKTAEEPENQSEQKTTEKPAENKAAAEEKKPDGESAEKTLQNKGQTSLKKEQDKKEKKEKKEKSKKKPSERNENTSQTAKLQNSYVVQKGDTLSQIVWREYRDLSKLVLVKERNHIENEDQIKEGQRIILPVY